MKQLFYAIIACVSIFPVKAQVFYHRLDITTENIYTFVASNLLSAGLNQLSKDRLVDTSFGHSLYKSDIPDGQIGIKDYSPTGLTAKDIFADCSFGTKLGYQSLNSGIFNWGIYGSVHYKINQFKYEYENNLNRQNIHRLQLGGGFIISFGDIEHATKFVIETGLRYNLPVHYNGNLGIKASNVIAQGLTSHYSIRFGGFGFLQGVGIFAEIPHYNLIKNNTPYSGLNTRLFTIGVTYTILPWGDDY